MKAVLLDTGPLGMITHPKSSDENEACREMVRRLVAQQVRVCLPEIADYELRRELIRANKAQGIRRLDSLRDALDYLPITTGVMLLAAQLWAQARNQGTPTAPNEALDGDVILAAHAIQVSQHADSVIVATTNVGHLAQFVDARIWSSL